MIRNTIGRQSGKSPQANFYTDEQVQLIVNTAVRQALIKQRDQDIAELEQYKADVTTLSVNGISCAFIMALHDIYGFGPKRLNRLYDKVVSHFECMVEGYVNIEDIEKWCIDYGVNLQVQTPIKLKENQTNDGNK